MGGVRSSPRFSSVVLATLVLALVVPSIATASTSELEFVGQEELALTGSEDETVWLKNSGNQAIVPTFSASVEDSDGNAVGGDSLRVVVVDDDGDTVPPGEVEPLGAYSVGRYRLHLKGSATETDLSGELVASGGAAGGSSGNGSEGVEIAPASISMTAGPQSDFDYGVEEVVYLSAIGAILLVMASWGIASLGGGVSLSTRLPALDFDFKTSFASTLTAVGALLATIIAAGVLPEETVNLSKGSFTALNLTFAVAVVLAGLAYSVFEGNVWVPKEGETSKEVRKPQGRFVGLLLACAITVWAVFGELWTMGLLVDELGQDQGFSGAAVDLFKAMLLAAFLAMCVYTPVRIRSAVKSERPKAEKGETQQSPTTPTDPGTAPADKPQETVTLL